MFAKLSKHDGLMSAMSHRAGLDLGGAILDGRMNPTEYRAAVLRCIGCGHADECGRLVAGGHESGPVPDFCVNRRFFHNLGGSRPD